MAYSLYEGRKGSQDQWRVPLPSTYRKIKDVLQLDDRFDSVLLYTMVIEYERRAMNRTHRDDYGTTEGQLGAMPTGSVDSIISARRVPRSARPGRCRYRRELRRCCRAG